MCGRFTQERPTSDLAEIFAAEDLAAEPGGRFNVAPTDDAAVVVQRDDRRAIRAYRWGLVPHWAESAKVGNRMFNARAETLGSSPVFRDAFRKRRCLVPVTSFMEWGGVMGQRSQHWFTVPSEPVFAFAGIWRDSEVPSFAFLTCDPNPLVGAANDVSMPVILNPWDYDRWLTADWKEARTLVDPFPAQLMAEARMPPTPPRPR